MSDQTVNIPLLRKAVEWAEAEAAKPEIDREWAQESWHQNPGSRSVELLWDAPDAIDTKQHERAVAAHCGTAYCIAGYVAQSLDARYAQDVQPRGMPHVADFAAEALGIEGHTSGLFHGKNTIEDVRRIAEDIAGERL